MIKTHDRKFTATDIYSELVQDGKMLLFLDIDNTIVVSELCPSQQLRPQIDLRGSADRSDSYKSYISKLADITEYQIKMNNGPIYDVEFRPGFFEFLASAPIKLIIITHGTFEYAARLVQIFDPKFQLVQQIFARVFVPPGEERETEE